MIEDKDAEIQREQRINSEYEDKIRKLQKDFSHEKEEMQRKKRELLKEVEFLSNEAN